MEYAGSLGKPTIPFIEQYFHMHKRKCIGYAKTNYITTQLLEYKKNSATAMENSLAISKKAKHTIA